MKCQTHLGPGCPSCDTGEWRLVEPREHFHRDGSIPLPHVTAEGRCERCSQVFYLDLAVSADSVWRSTVVPQTMGPLVGFGWLDATLYARGRTLGGDGSHYHVEYRLVDVWTPGAATGDEDETESDGETETGDGRGECPAQN